MRLLLFLAAGLMLSGCAGSSAVSESPVPDAPMWSREGLEEQPRMDAFIRRLPPEMGYTPGTTAWRPAALELDVPDAAATPGALLLQVASALPASDAIGREFWEQVLRLHLEKPARATGVILHWGIMDDAIIGHDHRVGMRQQGDTWQVEEVEERYHCARGVSEEGLCL